MKSLWGIYEENLSPSDCLRIRSQLTEPEKATLQDTDEFIVNEEYRRTEVQFLERENDELGLFEYLDAKVKETNDKFFGFQYDLPGPNSFQLGLYREGAFYKSHRDAFLAHLPPEEPRERKISFTLQLSDPKEYSGGDFILYESDPPDPEELRKQGTLFIFPAFYWHEVTPVTKGERYSLVGWYTGEHWR